MNYRLFGCGRYRRLTNEKNDRVLELKEREFMARHRAVCDECRVYESQSSSALNMLRLAAVQEDEIETGLVFEERILRRWRVQSTRESVRYWSPAFLGAAIAGLTVLAALQLVTNRPQVPFSTHPGGEARLERMGEQLPLIEPGRIDRMR